MYISTTDYGQLCAAEDIQLGCTVLGIGTIYVTIIFVCVKSVI